MFVFLKGKAYLCNIEILEKCMKTGQMTLEKCKKMAVFTLENCKNIGLLTLDKCNRIPQTHD